MSFAACKAGALSCWAAFRFVFDIVVIGPVLIFAFNIVLSAWPSPGAFILTQAEGLVRGAEPGKVWGCASLPDAVTLMLKGVPETVLCLPKQESRDAYAVAVDHSLFQLYGLVTTLYAVLYVALRFALNHFAQNTTVKVARGRQATSGMTRKREEKHGEH